MECRIETSGRSTKTSLAKEMGSDVSSIKLCKTSLLLCGQMKENVKTESAKVGFRYTLTDVNGQASNKWHPMATNMSACAVARTNSVFATQSLSCL